jgi:hypothetical protein
VLDLRQRASVWIATSFHQRPRMHKHANVVNTFFAWPPSQGADDDLRDRGAQADRVEPAHGVLPNPRALQVVYTQRPHDCNQPKHPPMTVRTRHSWSWSCGRAHRAPTDRQSAGWHRGLASGHRNLMRTTMASSAPAAPCADDAGLCWLGGSLSFFEEHTTAVCAIAPSPRCAVAGVALPRVGLASVLGCGSLAPGRRTDTTHGRGHGLYCTAHTPSCGRDHTTTINYCESRVLDQMPAACLQRQEGSPWLQSATKAAQLISKQSLRDGP